MRTLSIFRSGNHVASSGQRLTFDDATLRASAAAYDPDVHEAPIVVGHPKTDAPAYGWIGAVEYDDGIMRAVPAQVDAEFSELVRAGRYKKISASFYQPDSPSNPKPGVYYLRHVGFLGAAAPAVKGLKQIEFAADDDGVVEFAWSERENASLWRSLRDWLIDKFSLEEADRVVPPWAVGLLEQEAAQDKTPSFSDPEPKEITTVTGKSQAELDKQAADIAAREAALAQKEADFAEQQAQSERAARNKIAVEYVEGLVTAGKIMPRHKAGLTALIAGLPAEAIEFAEGDAQVQKPAADVLRAVLDALPAQIDYSERSGADRTPADPSQLDARSLAREARKRVNAAAAEGRSLSYTEAVNEVYEAAGGNQ